MLAALAYVPVLLAAPGRVGADTKQYLYLDPGRLLSRAVSMWDPNIGLGTVTHQNIGYLFPMGPWYWLAEQAGLPDWVAQRLWLGTILFAAGTGVLFLLRTLVPAVSPAVLPVTGWAPPPPGLQAGGPSPAAGRRGALSSSSAALDRARGLRPQGGPAVLGAFVAALAYMLSPYSLDYAARISVILLPWAGLPWMLGLVVRALRTGGWRHPAAFALVVALVGGVNATALIYAGVAPLLWLPFAVLVLREVTWGRVAATAARIGLLTLCTSLWWMAGLAAQAGYGLPILEFTETVEAVARTSLASEVLRGLGYWFFYGRDKLGPWIQPSVAYTQQVWLIAVGFAVPTAAFLAAAFTRWRHRSFFIGLILIGTVLAVGPFPFDHPSPIGALFKAAAEGSTVGLAMRSTARAVPLVVLGVAVLLGSGVSALARRRPQLGTGAALAAGVVVIAGIPPLFVGTLGVDRNLQRPEEIPGYWREAAAFLDRRDGQTRAWELPGTDFASYRWGNTVDPITPGLMDRSYVARELIPYGSAASADLLNAFDRRLQEGVLEPEAVAPIARLLGVGDVVLRNDLQFERYNTARPRNVWQQFTPVPAGLGAPVPFGPPEPNRPQRFPMLDEVALALPPGAEHPPPVAVLPVDQPRPIVRAERAERPLVLAGDGEGTVEAATVGMLAGEAPLLYSASLAGDPAQFGQALDAGADLVLTDTNRRRARRWSTLRENTGFTEQAGERPLERDLADARLDLFPEADDAARDDASTVVEQRGVRSVRATRYGNPVSYTPEDRPALALDGDPLSAWRVGAFSDPVGERVVVELDEPVTTDRLTLVQPLNGPRNRFLTRVELRFDGGEPRAVALDESSRTEGGQEVRFPSRTFERVEIAVVDTNVGRLNSYLGQSAVGLAEVRLADVRVDEVVRLPVDLLQAAGERSIDHRLAILMSRARVLPVPPRTDEEQAMARTFSLPTPRQFSVTGTARLSASVPDELLDRLLGLGGDGVVARSSGRLPGDVRSRARSALDGDRSSAWRPGLGPQEGGWLEVELPRPERFDRLDLAVVADGRHSVPSRLLLESEAGERRTVELPAVTGRSADQAAEGATADVPVRFEPLVARRLRVTVEAVHPTGTLDYYSEAPTTLPVGIAELGLPVVSPTPVSGPLPATCRDDLVAVDGRPLPVRLVGSREAAVAREGLQVEPCGPGDGALQLAGGQHEVRSRPGVRSGIDIDRLALASGRGGGASPLVEPGAEDERAGAPAVSVRRMGRTGIDLEVRGADRPFWLVLGQSSNAGWQASVEGGSVGGRQLVDGFANGWLVDPGGQGGGEALRVTLRWAPQRFVNLALVLSALGGVLCLVLAFLGRRRAPAAAGDDPELVAPWARAAGTPLPRHWAPPPAGPVVVGPVVVGPVVVALVTGAAVAPLVGLTVGLLVLVVLLAPRARPVLALGAVVGVAAAGADTAVQQYTQRFPPQFEWPTFFERAHLLAWLGIALLAADAVVEVVRTRQQRRPTPEPEPVPVPALDRGLTAHVDEDGASEQPSGVVPGAGRPRRQPVGRWTGAFSPGEGGGAGGRRLRGLRGFPGLSPPR